MREIVIGPTRAPIEGDASGGVKPYEALFAITRIALVEHLGGKCEYDSTELYNRIQADEELAVLIGLLTFVGSMLPKDDLRNPNCIVSEGELVTDLG